MRVIIDSRYERFLPKASRPSVTIEHVGRIPGRQMTTLACEYGLSLHLEAAYGGETIFAEKWLKDKDSGEIDCWGRLNRNALTAQNVLPVSCETPHALEGAFTSGYIERTTFEEITGGTLVEDFEHFSEAEKRGELVLDQHHGVPRA